jgi:L-seryl-tRNA(Ser) seleniumtransferase
VKIDPRLPQLPSLGELLEHPRVKGLIERVNRSTIAQRATGFLEEVRLSLADRAGGVDFPSVTHLAERLARRLLGEPVAVGPIVNATGLVYGGPELGMPWPDAAIHAVARLAGDYRRQDMSLTAATARELCAIAGGEAALVTSTFEAAVTLAVAATAGGRETMLFGAGNARGPIDWPHLTARAGCALLPATPSSQGAVAKASAAALVRAPDAEDMELARLADAKTGDAVVLDVAPFAGVLDPREYELESVPTIRDRLEAGADLVVADGAGLIGGPDCGLLIGRGRVVDAAARHPLAPLVAASTHVTVALEAVLRIHRGDGGGVAAAFQLPIWQLLTAPLANLEQRAQRLAALMAEAPGVASAVAMPIESPWRAWGQRQWSAKSWCVDVQWANEKAAPIKRRLARGPSPVLAEMADPCIRFDLRSVFPRWDQRLVVAVEELGGGDVAHPAEAAGP